VHALRPSVNCVVRVRVCGTVRQCHVFVLCCVLCHVCTQCNGTSLSQTLEDHCFSSNNSSPTARYIPHNHSNNTPTVYLTR